MKSLQKRGACRTFIQVPRKMLLAMRISFILLFGIFLQVSASGWAQKVSVKETQTTYKELFKEVERQTGLITILSNDEMDINGMIEVEEGTFDLKELYQQVLEDANMEFRLVDDYIVIKPSEKPLVQMELTQQEEKKVTIRGTVKDQNGEPLPFAAVCFKGTTVGCVSAVDGTYVLEAPDEEGLVLEVSSLGYKTVEIAVEGRTQIDVVLEEETMGLNEVVVTGYQTISKERATGSFQIVNADDITNVASVDLVDRLEGVAAGVKVNKDGTIVIRGASTLSAESNPLIVLNGHPWEGNLLEINPDDVEQLTVLKDAASASIYGVRGANGVIVITTKRGKSDGKLRVNYNGTFQMTEQPKLDDLNIMNTGQYVDLEWESYEKAGITAFPWYNYKSELGEIYAAMQAGSISEQEALAMRDELASYDNRRDIEELFFQREMVQKHTLSFNYGTAKNQFYASISFDENKAMWQGTKGDNISFNLNDRFKYNDLLQLNMSVLGNFRSNKSNGQFASMTRPYVRFFDEDGNYAHEANGSYDAATVEYHESRGLLPFFYNQVQEQELKDKESKSSNIATNASLDITPAEWLKFTASIGYSIGNGRTEDLADKESYRVRSYVNRYTAADMNQVIPYGNILWYDDTKTENLTTRLQMSINKQLKDFNVGFNAGWERNAFKTENNMGNARFNYNSQRLTENVVNWQDLTQGYLNAFYGWASMWQVPARYQSEDRFQSVFFLGNVSYKEKYDLSASWRLDKTNLFGQSSEYQDQPAWSVGAKWHLSREDFFDAAWIDELSLKGSYGLAGNIDKNTSPFLIANASTDYFTGEQALSVANPENPLLGWEKTYTTNIGMDYSLFNRRMFGSIEFYNKRSEDVLAYVNLDPTTGFGGSSFPWEQVKMNNGEILNRGFDLNIGASIIRQPAFSYDVNFNFSYNYNELLKVSKPANNRTDVVMGNPVEGQAIDFIYGYRNAGLDATGEPQVYDQEGNIVSWQEMGTFDIDDGKFIGRMTPPVFGSLNNHFTYKNLSADIFILYDFGHFAKQYNYPSPVRTAGSKNMINVYDKRWREAGDEAHTSIPKLDYTAYSAPDRYGAVWDSDYNIDNADVIQLKSINLTYDFTSLINVPAIKSLKLKVGIENLWHWTAADNDRIYDTKVSWETGGDLYYVRDFDFPRFKNYTFGLSMQF
ncbi:SusC/RagA family TonB-linked outer membrane protein [Carboxylicivirga sp. RSCT41]|uniref:SusC/RagA family TonB-linked outer membrane protein n=1 Tax=Carboxylicivirga agarovorans TaxID=3417570 RepID=UPI003D332643